MKFRIVKSQERLGYSKKLEILYFDENNSRGPKWCKVIWDEESYLNFVDNNFVETMEEAHQKAEEFMEKYREEHGTIVEEFELN